MTAFGDETTPNPFAEKFSHLIFDLDDTLLDTTGLLIEPAANEMCQAMVEAGLKADINQCLEFRHKSLVTHPRQDAINRLLEHFGAQEGSDLEKIRMAGFKAFYSRDIAETIQPFLGVPEMLVELHQRYSLFLVTLGSPPTQFRKLELLKIASLFTKVFVVDISSTTSKRQVLAEILEATQSSPRKFLSIGNRLDKDLAPAKSLGMSTCLVRHGELKHMTPTCAEEVPDFTIDRIQNLVEACRL